MSADATAPPRPRSSALSDFPDRLSPILVKELRQGLRTHLFTIAFLILQSLMLLCMMAGIADPGSNVADGFLWFFITATLLVVQPLRGFNAIASEHQLNTLDLIQMTRLNGWRIALGKWLALNAQGLLFVVAVLPYLVIRYFFGGVQFVQDLYMIGWIALGSGLATSITIGCSVFRSIILRGVLLVGLGILTLVAFQLIQASVLGSFSLTTSLARSGLLALTFIYGIYFFLGFGATRIAPLSENHATGKRLVALLISGLCLPFFAAGLDEEVLVCVGFILAASVVDAITEPLPIYSRVLYPFSRNPFTRLAAPFFSPGWLGGIGYFVLVTGIFLAISIFTNRAFGSQIIENTEDLVMYLSAANTIILPVALIHLFLGRYATTQFTFGLYLLIQGILLVVTIMVAAVATAIDQWERIAFLILPFPSVILTSAGNVDAGTPLHLAIAVLTFLLCITLPPLRNPRVVGEFFRQLKPRASR